MPLFTIQGLKQQKQQCFFIGQYVDMDVDADTDSYRAD